MIILRKESREERCSQRLTGLYYGWISVLAAGFQRLGEIYLLAEFG